MVSSTSRKSDFSEVIAEPEAVISSENTWLARAPRVAALRVFTEMSRSENFCASK